MHMAPGSEPVRLDIIGVDDQGLGEQFDCEASSFAGVGISVWERPQIKIVCVQIVWSFAFGALDFSPAEGWFDCANNVCRNLILKIEDVGKVAIELAGPQVDAS